MESHPIMGCSLFFRMTSMDEAPDFIVRRIAHLTVNGDGTVTVDRVDFETRLSISLNASFVNL